MGQVTLHLGNCGWGFALGISVFCLLLRSLSFTLSLACLTAVVHDADPCAWWTEFCQAAPIAGVAFLCWHFALALLYGVCCAESCLGTTPCGLFKVSDAFSAKGPDVVPSVIWDCPSRGIVRQYPVRRGLWLFWFWLFMARVGEASVPGPSPSWSLGVCNPGGLQDKAHLLPQDVDVWLVSETHFTESSFRSFRGSLCSKSSGYRWIVPGAFVPPRSLASDVGVWSGVAAVSSWPTRALPHSWPAELVASGRVLVSATCCHDLWITGVLVYGAPTGPTHPQAQQSTNAMLDMAIDRLAAAKGPRYIAGDWNHDLDRLTSVDRLHGLGFVEVQDLHFQRTGVLPRATCRGKTRRDFFVHFM